MAHAKNMQDAIMKTTQSTFNSIQPVPFEVHQREFKANKANKPEQVNLEDWVIIIFVRKIHAQCERDIVYFSKRAHLCNLKRDRDEEMRKVELRQKGDKLDFSLSLYETNQTIII